MSYSGRLEVEDLHVSYYTLGGVVRAVRGVSFTVDPGRGLCIVGESGSGKTTVGLAIAGALPPNARIVGGSIRVNGLDVASLDARSLEKVRGNLISMIFQDPAASFNPLFTIGQTLFDIARHKLGLEGKPELRDAAVSALRRVGMPDPERVLSSYPHELSGGMLQRAAIAAAILPGPRVLVADEPTTMLDVTLQYQILKLLNSLKRSMGLALVFITHNLGVAAEVCEETLVLYAGSVAELGPTEKVLEDPLHPYTRALLECVPTIDRRSTRLKPIPGSMPDPRSLPPGCVFHPRCQFVMEKCKKREPGLTVSGERLVSCFLYSEEGRRD
ncbi:MAG: ABC transporter ATP-binding protein [Desulfurococcales archaeon]|nr:ABC transporter ATP-binding protein [Desulfurococcales archaeon]